MTPTKAMISIRTRSFRRPFPLPSIFSGSNVDNSFAPPRRASTTEFIQFKSSSLRIPQQQHHSFVHRRHFHPTYQGLQGNLNDLCKNHIELPVEDFADGCRKFKDGFLFNHTSSLLYENQLNKSVLGFLHQVALGNIGEVKKIASSRRQLVNFKDYDRRSEFELNWTIVIT